MNKLGLSYISQIPHSVTQNVPIHILWVYQYQLLVVYDFFYRKDSAIISFVHHAYHVWNSINMDRIGGVNKSVLKEMTGGILHVWAWRMIGKINAIWFRLQAMTQDSLIQCAFLSLWLVVLTPYAIPSPVTGVRYPLPMKHTFAILRGRFSCQSNTP